MSEFRALIEEARGGGGAWVQVPPSVVEELGRAGRIPVRATFDGVPYRGSVVSMGGGTMVIGILKDIRASIGKNVGDEVVVTIDVDQAPREVELPEDLERGLADAGLAERFASLSFTKRGEIAEGVSRAKKADTRQRRIAAAMEELRRSE